MAPEKVLTLTNIHYSFGSNKALNGIHFDLYREEIHALTGDHRSGKSTIARILGGSLHNQVGTIQLKGRTFSTLTPKSSIQNRIGVVYQNPEIIPNMSAVENIFAGRMPHFLVLGKDKNKMRESCEELFAGFNIDIDIDSPLNKLAKGEQQIVSIARALSLGAEILILDEISQRLTPSEMNTIYAICRRIKSRGKSIIYITSNFDEVFKIADRVTVIREGYRRGTEKVEAVEPSKLVNLAYSMAYSKDSEAMTAPQSLLFTKQEEMIIRDLPIGMIILDSENRIRIMNTSAEKIFGLQDQNRESLDSLESILVMMGISEGVKIAEHIREKEDSNWENLTTNDDRILRIKSIPLFDGDAAFLGTNIFAEDVSIEYDTKEYLLRAEHFASTAELAAGLAHEINNPLGIIQNYIELIKLRIQDGETQSTISQIQKELNRIVEIVGSLLSFSRVKQHPVKIIRLDDLIDEILLLLSHLIKEKRVQLYKQLPARSVTIKGYENKLKQLFMNLMMNSLEAVLTGGRMSVTLKPEGEHVEVVIEDNGYGIPEDIQNDIFKPFFSTKMTKKNTGLGLSICQHIVESHKGVITFNSIPGEVTRFSVKLPLVQQTRSRV